MITKELLVELLKTNIDQHIKLIQKFAKKVVLHPGHEMEWADGVVRSAATFEIMGEVYHALTGKGSKATVETIREYAMDRILYMAAFPERSTSISQNVLEREKLAAWATIVKWIDERI